MSDISIVRWFLKCTILNLQTTDTDKILKCKYGYYNVRNYKSLHISGKIILAHRYCDNINILALYKEEKKSWIEFIFHDVQEFLNYDDISLVLKYGRIILDENIIRSINSRDIEITMDDMKEIMNGIRN